MSKNPAVYILASKRNGTLYTGVTSNLLKRIFQHTHAVVKHSFTARYECKILVYYEQHCNMYNAISREKQIKAGSRKKKIMLIESMNPEWKNLAETLY